jgi:YfiH family protein
VKVAPTPPAGVMHITEVRDAGGLYVHPHWREEMPWLAQGITGRDGSMSLFTDEPVGAVLAAWQALRAAAGCRVIVHARQVHEATVHCHRNLPAGLLIAPDADGHVTADDGALLAVSVADCVPISIVAPRTRAIAQLHGGWRGVAADILEHGVSVLADQLDARVEELHVHLGPAICGECYEVGSEVVARLGLDGDDITHVDVRATLAHRALELGIPAHRISTSTYCTKHGNSPFYSHRGGCRERQISVLGLRA